MPGTNGFDVIKALQADLMPMVVFSTAYQRYALDAFDLHAVDYILKPVDKERLLRGVRRAYDRFQMDKGEGQHKPALIGAIDEIAKHVVKIINFADIKKDKDEEWMRFIDLKGLKFGRLSVVKRSPNAKFSATEITVYQCICEY